jgi:hypothetical protein
MLKKIEAAVLYFIKTIGPAVHSIFFCFVKLSEVEIKQKKDAVPIGASQDV